MSYLLARTFGCSSEFEQPCSSLVFEVVSVGSVTFLVFHDAGDLREKIFVVAGTAKEVEIHLHPRWRSLRP